MPQLLEQVHSCEVSHILGGFMPFASSARGGRTQTSDKQDAWQVLLSPNITSPVCFACTPGVAVPQQYKMQLHQCCCVQPGSPLLPQVTPDTLQPSLSVCSLRAHQSTPPLCLGTSCAFGLEKEATRLLTPSSLSQEINAQMPLSQAKPPGS